MATTQIQSSAALGKFLQRVYSDGITNQISEDFRDWEMVSKHKVTDQAARTVDFLINKTYGAPAVEWKDSGSQKLPSGSQSSTEEGSAGFNQIYCTVELEYDLWERAKSGAKKYLEPLAHEIQNKGIVQKRILSAAFHLDGRVGSCMDSRLGETEQLVRRMKNPPVRKSHTLDPDIQYLQDNLSEELCARVKLQHGSKGKGKMVISYNSTEELEGILEQMGLKTD